MRILCVAFDSAYIFPSNLDRCGSGTMLGDSREDRPVDGGQESLRLCSHRRDDLWKIHENVCHIFACKYFQLLTFASQLNLHISIVKFKDLTVFGAGIPNLLVASQNIELLGLRVSNGKFDFSFCYWLIIIGIFLCPLMWLGSPKNMKWVKVKIIIFEFCFYFNFSCQRALASTSVIICTSVAVLTWASVLKESDDPNIVKVDSFDPFNPPFINLLKAYGIISFQFDIHPMLLTIAVDMQNRREIGRAVFSGLLTTLSLSLITTIIVSGTYGQGITSNVLQSLPKSWELYAIIGLVTVQLCLSNAVGSSALFQHIEDLFKIPRGKRIIDTTI